MKITSQLTLSPDELRDLCGGYSQPAKQLDELRRQGFWRARRSNVTGQVVLERAHYEAVCAGRAGAFAEPELKPALLPAGGNRGPKKRSAAARVSQARPVLAG